MAVKKGTSSNVSNRPKKSTAKSNGNNTSTRNTTRQSNKINTQKPKNQETARKNKTEDQELLTAKESRIKQTKAILLLLAGVLLFLIVIFPGENLWTFAHQVVIGLFGQTAIGVPIVMIFIAIVIGSERKIHTKIRSKVLLSFGIVMSLCTLIYIASVEDYMGEKDFFTQIQNLYITANQGEGAGVVSGLIGIPLDYAVGQQGAFYITVLALVGCTIFLFGITIKSVFELFGKPISKAYNNYLISKSQKKEDDLQKIQNENNGVNRNKNIKDNRQKSIFENEDFLLEDNFKEDRVIDIKLDGEEKKTSDKAEDLKDKRNDLLSKASQMFNNKKEEKHEDKKQEPLASFAAKTVMENKKTPKKPDPEQLQPDPQTVKVELSDLEMEIKQNANEDSGYRFPPVELLVPNYTQSEDDFEALTADGEKLITALNSFSVRASVTNICKGPSVTRFEVQPAPGVKISKITSLTDDIALNLAASNGVRIEAPIPGKPAIGIEVPNKTITTVSMRELIDSHQFKREKSKLTVVLGKDISNNIVSTDLSKMPHLLVAGTTGSGKSVCVNSILLSLLYKAKPSEVKLLLIDPKMVEFSKYKGIPHLLIPVVADVKKAAGALNWAVNEMTERYKSYAAYNVKDIKSYNNMVSKYHKKYADLPSDMPVEDRPLTEEGLPIPESKMPQIVIAIDELADLMMTAPHEVEESICRLAQKARACGMHLVIATQRPSVNVITGVIKANIPSRIALKTSSQVDSRTIIDVAGAEKLIGKGDMLFAPIGCNKPLRVQGCFASDEEIENVTGYIKKSYQSEYNEEIVEEIEKIAATQITVKGKDDLSDSSNDEDRDEMLETAIKLVIEEGQASTSHLQRRLRLGYARAGRIMDTMEQMGIVGPSQGAKPREILMSHQEWLEREHMKSE